jgi:uncharacterized protein (DUF433 family)
LSVKYAPEAGSLARGNFGFEGVVMEMRPKVVVTNPGILGGTPVFRGTRVPFQSLIDYLEGGQTLTEFLDDFPSVSRQDAVLALDTAAAMLVGARPVLVEQSR